MHWPCKLGTRNTCMQEIGQGVTFVPIILETTERFGEAAMVFLRKPAGKRYHLMSKLVSECSTSIRQRSHKREGPVERTNCHVHVVCSVQIRREKVHLVIVVTEALMSL